MMTNLFFRDVSMLSVCALLSLGSCLAHAATYKCKNASGAIAYQESPCQNTDTPQIVDNTKQQKKPDHSSQTVSGGEGGIAFALMVKASCDLSVPIFKNNSEKIYAQWRQANIQIIQKIGKMPGFQDGLTRQVQQWAQGRKNLSAQEQEKECDHLIDEMNDGAREPDPRFSSAEKTLQTYISALESGDRKLALSCLTMRARDICKPILETASEADLKKMSNSVKSVPFHYLRKGSVWLISEIPGL